MNFHFGGPSVDASRAQSAMLGLVLLIGMVVTVSVGIFLVAGETMAGLEQQTEEERVESAFVELGQQVATTASSSDTTRTIDLDVGRQGAVVREESGTINVSWEEQNKSLEDLTIGTVEYESDSGSTIAYEAGAVFREKGNETRVISAPQIQYDAATDTFTLPVVTVTGEQQLGSGDVAFTHEETLPFPDENVVRDDSVRITVQSDYYRGWEAFFEEQAGDTSVRNVDHENRTVEVLIGYIDLENAFETGVTYSEEVDDFDEEFDDDARRGNMPEMDDVIEQMLEEAEDDPDGDLGVVDDGMTIADASGLYYADEVDLDDDVTWQLEDDTSLVVDGDFAMHSDDANWTVETHPDHTLRVYVTGDFDFHNGNMQPVPSSGEPKAEQLQVYGTSELTALFHGGSFHGTFYAASSSWDGPNELGPNTCNEYQVCFHSNPDFTGGVVAYSVNLHASAVEFEYDDSLEDGVFDAYPDKYQLPPQLTYLNVAKHEVEVEQN